MVCTTTIVGYPTETTASPARNVLQPNKYKTSYNKLLSWEDKIWLYRKIKQFLTRKHNQHGNINSEYHSQFNKCINNVKEWLRCEICRLFTGRWEAPGRSDRCRDGSLCLRGLLSHRPSELHQSTERASPWTREQKQADRPE